MLGYLSPAKKHTSERVISPDGCCFTLLAMTHGYGQGYIMEYEKDSDRQNSEDRTRRRCYKFGAATLLRTTGPTMSKVIEIYEDKESIRDSKDTGQGGQGRETKSETLYDVPAHQRGLRS